MSNTLFISEFPDLPFTSNGIVQAPGAQYWVTDQTVSISGSSASSAAFNLKTRYVVLSADASCSIACSQGF